MRWLRRPRPDPGPRTVDAWQVDAGDELEGGLRVIAVHRDAGARTVRIVVDDPAVNAVAVDHDYPVRVVRQVM